MRRRRCGRRCRCGQRLVLLLFQRLHLSDVPVDLGPFGGRQVLGLAKIVVEGIDGLVGLVQVLVAASDVAQIRRMWLLRVEFREEIGRFLVAAGRKGMPGVDLALVGFLGRRQCHRRLAERADGAGEQDREQGNAYRTHDAR